MDDPDQDQDPEQTNIGGEELVVMNHDDLIAYALIINVMLIAQGIPRLRYSDE